MPRTSEARSIPPREEEAEEIKIEEIEVLEPRIVSSCTEASERRAQPEDNEDTHFVDSILGTAGVFDGAGGHQGGKEASRLAAVVVKQALEKLRHNADVDECINAVKDALEEAHKMLMKVNRKRFYLWWDRDQWKQETSQYLFDDDAVDKAIAESGWQNKNPASVEFQKTTMKEIYEMTASREILPIATTASIVKIVERAEGGAHMVYGHVGDSRIYVLRAADKKLEQITADQSAFQGAVEKNFLTPKEASAIDQSTGLGDLLSLSDETIRGVLDLLKIPLRQNRDQNLRTLFEYRNKITGSLGGQFEMEPQIAVARLEPGDLVVKTTDGIHDNLTNEEIRAAILEAIEKGKDVATYLAQKAKERAAEKTWRSKADDKTAVVIQIAGKEEPKPTKPKKSDAPRSKVSIVPPPKGETPRVEATAGPEAKLREEIAYLERRILWLQKMVKISTPTSDSKMLQNSILRAQTENAERGIRVHHENYLSDLKQAREELAAAEAELERLQPKEAPGLAA